MDACLFVCCCFFPPGVIVSTHWSWNVARGLNLTEKKSFSALFKRTKNCRAPRPPPTLIIFSKSTGQNSPIAILFSIVEKSYNYASGDHLLPHSPRGRGYKLQTLTSAYI